MASRKEEKERRRQERLAQERAAAQRTRARRLYGIIAAAVLTGAAIVAIAVAVLASGGGDDSSSSGATEKAQNTLPPPPQKIRNLEQAAKAARCDLKNPPIEGRNHVLGPVKYGTNPPTSGNHYPIPTPDGVYMKEPQPTHFVHTLEHGRIEIQYSPSLSKKRIRQLGGLFNEDPHILLLFPNPTMPYDVAVTAWGHLAGCKKMTDASFDVIRTFRDRYIDRAPEPSTTQPANF
jgi:hypothetical protein